MEGRWFDRKSANYALMAALVVLWGLDYIAAKAALDNMDAVSLVFFKYLAGLIIVLPVKCIIDRRFPFKKKDIPFFLVCAIFGDILYFASEYQAMTWLPVSIITIMLAFVPAVSIVAEIFIYKRKPTLAVVIGILVGIAGVSLVVGADFRQLFSGKIVGYLLIFFAMISWNIYNFVTARLGRDYGTLDLTLYQTFGVLLVAAPWIFFHMPSASVFTGGMMLSILYLGVVSAGVGLLIYVNAVRVIGVTPCALYSNMLPVTTTFFGYIFLNETISPIQILGGIIVITAGCVVIWLHGK